MIQADGSNLAFIMGCPRSGTTWLHRLVASHPLVATGQESNLFDFYVGPQLRSWKNEVQYFDGRGPNGLHCYLTEAQFLERLRRYALSLFDNVAVPTGGRFLEKTPSHVCFAPEIMALFPQAKIILISRHPFGAIASLLQSGKTWGQAWAPVSLRAACSFWNYYAAQTRAAREQIPAAQRYECSFEDLKSRGAIILKEIFDFLGLECTPAEVAVFLEANRPGNAGMTGIPLYGDYAGQNVSEPEGFYRKQDTNRPLSAFARVVIKAWCRREMAALGYK
jgi:hypothetical protein